MVTTALGSQKHATILNTNAAQGQAESHAPRGSYCLPLHDSEGGTPAKASGIGILQQPVATSQSAESRQTKQQGSYDPSSV
jgi:hypothetical protein